MSSNPAAWKRLLRFQIPPRTTMSTIRSTCARRSWRQHRFKITSPTSATCSIPSGTGWYITRGHLSRRRKFQDFLRLEAWICLDVPDTDFLVTFFEILSDGSSIQLSQDLLRARYRRSLERETLVTPGEIERYVFDGFNFFSRRISRGSRLRLFINSPNSIYLQKNYNSGGEVLSERANSLFYNSPGFGDSGGQWTILGPQSGGHFARGYFGPEITFAPRPSASRRTARHLQASQRTAPALPRIGKARARAGS